jgi:hypothetical protein
LLYYRHPRLHNLAMAEARALPAPQTTCAETGVTSAALAMPSSSARSAAPPASATTPGVSTVAAFGSTRAAAQSSYSVDVPALLRRRPRRSSLAPQTTCAETGVTSAAAAMFALPGRSAAQLASRAAPGAPTVAASGSIKAAVPSSACAKFVKSQEPLLLGVVPGSFNRLKPPEKNQSAS